MGSIDEYRAALRSELDWDRFLLANSGLPGPRGNIELGRAAAELARPEQIWGWVAFDPSRAPGGAQEEFLAFCGVIGLGRLAVEGDRRALPQLRRSASDPRWRIREAVAMALQHVGRADFDWLLREVTAWAQGTCLEQRAAAAGLCEPSLLSTPQRAADVLAVLDRITGSMVARSDRSDTDFKILRKGLGYCWSVAAVADPDGGKRAMERWIRHQDHDVQWVMRQNLGKKRMVRMDPAWVERQLGTLAPSD